VSRVVPNTSAYKAQPKLCEGDQVGSKWKFE
jgi:hypothetical protein